MGYHAEEKIRMVSSSKHSETLKTWLFLQHLGQFRQALLLIWFYDWNILFYLEHLFAIVYNCWFFIFERLPDSLLCEGCQINDLNTNK